MKYFMVLVGLLLCISIVSCRHYSETSDTEEQSSDESEYVVKAREHAANQMRHRRKRWNNYGYDYPPPPPYSLPYYPDRRDYDRNHQDLMPQILRLLDEISAYIKRPPPPPQPIYIPYPVPYPIPQVCTCAGSPNGSTPNVDKRLKPDLEDTNQNWGLVESNDDTDYEDGGDGARPISFDPIKPQRPMQRPAPKVEHGSTQEAKDLKTQAASAPGQGSLSSRGSTACNVAILSCCSQQQQKACFTKFGCAMTFAKGNACSQDSISSALDSFKTAYAPAY